MRSSSDFVRSNCVSKSTALFWGEPLPRNSVDGNQVITHGHSLLLHSFESSFLEFLFVCCLTCFDITSSILKHRIIDDCELAGRGSDRFGRAGSGLDAPVKSPERALASR